MKTLGVPYPVFAMAFANPQKIVDQLQLADGMEVADFGAGAGYLAIAAAEKVGESGEVYVIDIQEELLTRARTLAAQRHLKSLNFIHADVEVPRGTTLTDGLCDFVIMSNILFQLDNKEGAITEAARILKPGGKLAIMDWSDSFGGLGPQPEHIVPESDVRALAESKGFSFVRPLDAGDHHYGLIFKRNGG
jgi:ubiquinone/menaquinone biosynthesis C-methylase UbiE